MNSLRFRIAKLKPDHGAGLDFIFGLQVSQDGLNWWTIGRYKTFDECLGIGKGLVEFIRSNLIVKDEVILWNSTV
jgi:hypothetical protein